MVVAHRLSTIRQCDRIIVLDKGRIVEDGTYDELIKLNGFFKELVERQQINPKQEAGEDGDAEAQESVMEPGEPLEPEETEEDETEDSADAAEETEIAADEEQNGSESEDSEEVSDTEEPADAACQDDSNKEK